MSRIPITIWNRINQFGKSQFNHIQEGWCADDFPTPVSDEQAKSWLGKNVKWERKYGHLENGCVVEEKQ